jgi:hypothetical protein
MIVRSEAFEEIFSPTWAFWKDYFIFAMLLFLHTDAHKHERTLTSMNAHMHTLPLRAPLKDWGLSR